MIAISNQFDSANIEVVASDRADDIQLRIRPDNGSDFFQWFHFRLQGAKGTACRMRLLNASRAAYPGGWENYHAVASYDRQEWFRVESRYDGNELVIEHQPDCDSVYYAYFAPYSWERHQDLLGWAQQSSLCRLERLGVTHDGRDLDLLIISASDQASLPRLE